MSDLRFETRVGGEKPGYWIYDNAYQMKLKRIFMTAVEAETVCARLNKFLVQNPKEI